MFSLPGSQLPPIRGDSANTASSERASTSKLTLDDVETNPRSIPNTTSVRRKSSASLTKSNFISPPSSSASVFIPRTSRTSTGFKKPITKMTHSELHAFIDRNTRLLSNESVASKLGCAQRKSVQEDLEAAKRRLEGGSLAPAEGRGLVHTLGDLTLRGEGEAEAERQMESAADVKRRLVSCSSWSNGTNTNNTTVLLSNAESTSIQSRLYEAAQQERQQRKVLRGLELMTGLGRRLGDVGVGVVREEGDDESGADSDEDDEDITRRYLENDDNEDDEGYG